jgi:hypothetical protein
MHRLRLVYINYKKAPLTDADRDRIGLSHGLKVPSDHNLVKWVERSVVPCIGDHFQIEIEAPDFYAEKVCARIHASDDKGEYFEIHFEIWTELELVLVKALQGCENTDWHGFKLEEACFDIT